MRLAKYLARHGVASRRECESIIIDGRVKIGGKIVYDPAIDIDENSNPEVDNYPIIKSADHSFSYIILNKPIGVNSTMKSGNETGFTIADLIDYPSRIFLIGRLDRNTSGLILLTDNGDLTNKLTHPGGNIQKEYVVKLQRELSRSDIHKLARGISIDDRIAEVDDVCPIGKCRYSVVIHEGRKHIVRRLLGAINHRILELKRVRIGSQLLGKLGLGKWRKLNNFEIRALLKLVDIKPSN